MTLTRYLKLPKKDQLNPSNMTVISIAEITRNISRKRSKFYEYNQKMKQMEVKYAYLKPTWEPFFCKRFWFPDPWSFWRHRVPHTDLDGSSPRHLAFRIWIRASAFLKTMRFSLKQNPKTPSADRISLRRKVELATAIWPWKLLSTNANNVSWC